MQIAPVRVPIDIEPARVFGRRAPLQHVEPPRIIGTANTHVVGHEIEHLTETAVAKRRHHVTECRLVAELRVELAMVYDVIPVSAARPRLQVGRGIDVADAQPRQIGSEVCGIPETEALAELQAGGPPRDRRCTALRPGFALPRGLVRRAPPGRFWRYL